MQIDINKGCKIFKQRQKVNNNQNEDLNNFKKVKTSEINI